MLSMTVSLFLLLLAAPEGLNSSVFDSPPQPKLSETYKAWIFQTIFAENTTIEANGYTVRDQLGGREIQNVTIRFENGTLLEQSSTLHRMDINTTFMTNWDITGNVTCVKMVGSMTSSIWDWVQYTNYTGRDYFFNMDEWFYFGSRLNQSYVDDLSLSVSIEDPSIPLLVYDHTYAIRTVFYGFDPSYKPLYSDFQIPANCSSSYYKWSSWEGQKQNFRQTFWLTKGNKRKQRLFFF